MHVTTNAVPGAQATPWYTHRWPWLLMLGPVSSMVVVGIATTLAMRHPDAMVVDDYYKQGKAINQDLRRDRVASGMQLSFEARYGDGRLQGRIASFGKPLGTPFTIHLAHPTLPERDLTLLVKPDADGAFSVALPALEKTHWQVVVEGSMRDWRLAKGWSWPQQQELAIQADKS